MRNLLLSVILLVSIPLPTFAQTGWAGASWVWDEADANKVTQNNEPRFLRNTFDLKAVPLSAELWVTADNLYVAYINGKKIGADAEWATVEKYDVAKHLIVGKNVLAIQATNQGGVAGAIARLHVKTADKKDLVVVTDEKTKIRRAGSVSDGWQKPDFDDASWFAAIVLGDPGIGPWSLTGGAVAKGKGKKGGGQFGYDTNETVAVKGRLSAEEQKKHFIVPKDFEIELVAADPLVINPITMVMDEKGRIIVSESHTYRYGPPGSPIKPYANPVIRLDPDGKGGFTRTLIADGFADPVMGIAIKGDKLWLTANNYLYTYDLPESPGTAVPGKEAPGKEAPGTAVPGLSRPLAINKKTIVTDLNKAWNPFGMFVLEWGPDGKLYMSVGNHAIKLQGPDKDQTSGRGGSGIVVRMNPDGSKMERLVHGLRVPYSFEMDPFGQLWVLSNGEGNPNRFVRVIDGVDYHCYSRGAVDNTWLVGNSPLAPPSEEQHRGAHTQLMRYYGAAYPREYQGNLFLCNWGAHGFAGPNRAINRFVPDERNHIVKREPLVWCKDPHFRPAHIMYDQDGSILIADWYGRDDESDLTGRIWRLKYVGKDAPVVKHKLDADEWRDLHYAASALGSPSHLIREKAMDVLVKSGNAYWKLTSDALALYLAKEGRESALGAAGAIWASSRIRSPIDITTAQGTKHPDWRIRRLAVELARSRSASSPDAPDPEHLKNEKDSGVLIALARGRNESNQVRSLLLDALTKGAASDVHLRYEAAWHLAKHADEKAITSLLTSDDANVRLAGLIAIDVACYENFPTKKAALEALGKALENPGKLDHQLLLTVAQLDGDASIVPGLLTLIAREDLPAATIAKAVLVLKAKSGGSLASAKLSAAAGKRLIEAVEKGTLKIATPADHLVMFEFLEAEGPTPFALKQIGGQLQTKDSALKQVAHTLARRFGTKSAALADPLWPSVLNPKTKFDDTIEYLSTIARVESAPKAAEWEKLLAHPDPLVRLETIRWWRKFEGNAALTTVLNRAAEDLVKKDASIQDDLTDVLRHLAGKKTQLLVDKDDLTKHTMKALAAMPAEEKSKRAALGLQVFERHACTKCHTTATATTPLAPSLKGIAGQKVDYLIESVLFPSKIIKTGFESELIELKNGKTLTGLVKDEGKFLRVLSLDKDERIAKTDVETRAVTRVSVMPDGQEAILSRREFVDLIAYLATLK